MKEMIKGTKEETKDSLMPKIIGMIKGKILRTEIGVLKLLGSKAIKEVILKVQERKMKVGEANTMILFRNHQLHHIHLITKTKNILKIIV